MSSFKLENNVSNIWPANSKNGPDFETQLQFQQDSSQKTAFALPALYLLAEALLPYLPLIAGSAAAATWQTLPPSQRDIIISTLQSLKQETMTSLYQALREGKGALTQHPAFKAITQEMQKQGLPPRKPHNDNPMVPFQQQEKPDQKSWQIIASLTPSREDRVQKRVNELIANGEDPILAEQRARDEEIQREIFPNGINPEVVTGGKTASNNQIEETNDKKPRSFKEIRNDLELALEQCDDQELVDHINAVADLLDQSNFRDHLRRPKQFVREAQLRLAVRLIFGTLEQRPATKITAIDRFQFKHMANGFQMQYATKKDPDHIIKDRREFVTTALRLNGMLDLLAKKDPFLQAVNKNDHFKNLSAYERYALSCYMTRDHNPPRYSGYEIMLGSKSMEMKVLTSEIAAKTSFTNAEALTDYLQSLRERVLSQIEDKTSIYRNTP